MKRIWILAALCVASLASAQTTTTYTGTIKDLTGATVTSGKITWTLNAPSGGNIPGTGAFVSTTVSCTINASGAPVSSSDGVSPCVITNNTSLTPTGTSYTLCIQPYFVTPGSCYTTFATGGSVNISTLVPTPATQPSYGIPSTTAANTWSSKQAFGGGAAVTGGLTSDTLSTGNVNGCIWVDGVNYAKTNAGIQAAVNAAGNNGCVYLPPGTYPLTATTNEQIKITGSLNFMCSGWQTRLQLASTVGAIPLLHIVPSGIVSGVRVQDCAFVPQSGTPGSYAVQVDTSPNNPLQNFVFEHNCIGNGCVTGSGNVTSPAFGTGAIYLNNSADEVDGGIFDSFIEHSWIQGGIRGDLLGDFVVIKDNLIQGSPNWAASGFHAPAGIDMNFVPGASSIHIEGNTINPVNNAAIHFGGGDGVTSAAALFAVIERNEIETPNNTGTGSNGAVADLDGSTGSRVLNAIVQRNSFQIASGLVINSLRLNYANGVHVEDNNFGAPTAPGHNIIATANVGGGNIVGKNQYNGTAWSTVMSDSGPEGNVVYTNQTPNDLPLTLRDNSGNVFLYGFNGALTGYFTNGTTQFNNGAASPSVALVLANAPSALPASGNYATIYNGKALGTYNAVGGYQVNGNQVIPSTAAGSGGSGTLVMLGQTCTTGSIGGGALTAGQSTTGTCTLGATATGHVGITAASDGSVQGNYIAQVSVSGTTATVTITAVTAGTPTAKTYNVTVF